MSNFKDLDDANAAYEHLKKLYESAGNDIKQIKEKNDQLVAELSIAIAKLDSCGTSNEIIKNVMRNSLEDYNKKTQEYIQEIQELRSLNKNLQEELNGNKH